MDKVSVKDIYSMYKNNLHHRDKGAELTDFILFITINFCDRSLV